MCHLAQTDRSWNPLLSRTTCRDLRRFGAWYTPCYLPCMASLRAKISVPIILSVLIFAAGTACSGSVQPPEDEGDGDGDGDGDLSPGGDGDSDSGGDGDGDGDIPPGGDGDGDGDTGGCVVDGVTYEVGEVVSHDCNECTCTSDGVECTLIDCGDGDGTDPLAECLVGDEVYQSGESFVSDCNTCSCYDGSLQCTLIACEEPTCELPFEGGDCDGAFPVYFHNPDTGMCEAQVYGGCGGNENRFSTLEECEATCGGAPSGTSCEVNGVVYPDGATNVPDPGSCNTCSCADGVVTHCTEINCPVECEDGTALGSECAECGPTDACLTVRTGCLPTCESHEDCASSGGVCLDGLCKNACG